MTLQTVDNMVACVIECWVSSTILWSKYQKQASTTSPFLKLLKDCDIFARVD
jgi:hypothetical protein